MYATGRRSADALQRHAEETLSTRLRLGVDPQPAYVYQWFPPAVAPSDGLVFGDDPRKHAIGLSFVVELAGHAAPREEAVDFAWFTSRRLPTPLWPGCEALLARLGHAAHL